MPGPNSSVQSPFAGPAPLPRTFKKPLRTTHQYAFAPVYEHLHFYTPDFNLVARYTVFEMALQSNILHLARKSLLQESCKQFLLQTHGLHKSRASGSLEIAAHSQADLKEENMVRPVAEEQKVERVKTLHEMPGPSAMANLIEFFYRDGFSRIHEIQVSLQWSNGTTVTRYFLCLHFSGVSSSAQFTPSIHVQWKRPRRNHVDSSIWFHLTNRPHISILSKLYHL